MARGDTPHLDGKPDGGPANRREILAQFETAIAEMRTRDIQMGLRQLLAGTVPPGGSHGVDQGSGVAAPSAFPWRDPKRHRLAGGPPRTTGTHSINL